MADSGEQDHDRSRGGRRSREPPAAGEQDHGRIRGGLRSRERPAAGEQGHGRRSREPPAGGEQAHGRSSRSLGPGQPRRLLHRPPSPRISPYAIHVGIRNRLEMAIGGGRETKLYISNLGNGVSDDDIRVLFSDVGEVKDYAVHYDRNGRPRGTGEVVFFRHSDALAAMRRYHNVPLDGRPMKIEEVGVHFGIPAVPPMPMPMPGLILGHPRPLPIGPFEFVPPQIGGYARYEQGESSRGGGHDIRPQGPSGHEGRMERSHQRQPTASELDAELDRYHLEAKKKQD